MALCLAGTAGGVFALTRNAATPSVTTGAFDKAVYLYWTTGNSSLSLSNITDLSAGAPQYRYLTVAPQTTKSVTGTVRLDFTLAAEASKHMKGLTVSVYETSALATDQTVEGLIDGVTAAPVLTEANGTGYATFSVASSSTAHETPKYYAIEVVWSGSNDSEHTDYPLGATLTIAQSFSV